jgi:hypothetical protein
MGATDRRALDWLVKQGAQVRVSTACIGSSNLSSAALLDGLEWNVRLAALETPAMLAKVQATFDAYWEEGEFEPYDASPEQVARLDHQLASSRGEDPASSGAAPVWFSLRPYAYQREMLDALAAERSLHHRWRNLVVAATGTGKTILAAFDVARLHADFPEQFPSPGPPPLAGHPVADALKHPPQADRHEQVGAVAQAIEPAGEIGPAAHLAQG